MVREMKQQITQRRLPWTVKFVIEPEQTNVYDEFCKQVLSSDEGRSYINISFYNVLMREYFHRTARIIRLSITFNMEKIQGR
jgi:hypothetical protein